MAQHKFKVGQLVNLERGFSSAVDGGYEILRLLPVEGEALLYRIKSKREVHERVAREDQLSFAKS